MPAKMLDKMLDKTSDKTSDRGFVVPDIHAAQLLTGDVASSQAAVVAWTEIGLQNFFSYLEKKEAWPDEEKPSLLAGARYALLNDGGATPAKRLRPWFLLVAGAALAVPLQQLYHLALAIELIHGYSLVHDDLPAMDDDATRRGKPTLHRAFLHCLSAKENEAFAILVGDLLQGLAFELLAMDETIAPAKKNILLGRLAQAAGFGGMVSGQWRDMMGAKTVDEANQLKSQKTGALIELSLTAPWLGVNDVGKEAGKVENNWRTMAKNIGLLYQAVDDMMDEVLPSDAMGKKTGKDRAAGKSTTIALGGIEQARAEINQWMQAVEVTAKDMKEGVIGLNNAAIEVLLAWLRAVVKKIA